LWRDAVSAARTGTAYLAETEPGQWREGSWQEAAQGGDGRAHGPPSPGGLKGGAFGVPTPTRAGKTPSPLPPLPPPPPPAPRLPRPCAEAGRARAPPLGGCGRLRGGRRPARQGRTARTATRPDGP